MTRAHLSGERPVDVDWFPDDVSPYGVRGMAGNVSEWTSDGFIKDSGCVTIIAGEYPDKPIEFTAYLRGNNLNRTDLSQIAFRLRHDAEGGSGKTFFNQVLAHLTQRFTYHHELWSYALYHQDVPRIRDYLAHSPLADRVGLALDAVFRSFDVAEHLVDFGGCFR